VRPKQYHFFTWALGEHDSQCNGSNAIGWSVAPDRSRDTQVMWHCFSAVGTQISHKNFITEISKTHIKTAAIFYILTIKLRYFTAKLMRILSFQLVTAPRDFTDFTAKTMYLWMVTTLILWLWLIDKVSILELKVKAKIPGARCKISGWQNWKRKN
jgi:hypothetical protein